MTVLNNYLKKQAELERLQKEIEAMKSDGRLKADLEFKDKVLALMAEHGKSKSDVINLLNPENSTAKASAGSKSKRRLKRYTNPHNNEIVETRGGNNKTIRAWKEEHGSKVDDWFEYVD